MSSLTMGMCFQVLDMVLAIVLGGKDMLSDPGCCPKLNDLGEENNASIFGTTCTCDPAFDGESDA